MLRQSRKSNKAVFTKGTLSNRIFKNYDDIVDACCAAWKALIAEPTRIASIATREWASVIP
jgi:hypothetical protein